MKFSKLRVGDRFKLSEVRGHANLTWEKTGKHEAILNVKPEDWSKYDPEVEKVENK